MIFWLLARRLPDRRGGRGGTLRLTEVRAMIRQRAWLIFAASVFILWFSVMGAFAFLGIVIVEMGGAQRRRPTGSSGWRCYRAPLMASS